MRPTRALPLSPCKFTADALKPDGHNYIVGKTIVYHIKPANPHTLSSLKQCDPFSILAVVYTPEQNEVRCKAQLDVNNDHMTLQYVPEAVGLHSIYFVCTDEVKQF